MSAERNGDGATDAAEARVATADRVLSSVGGGLHSASAAVAAKQAAAAASQTAELAKRRRRAEASAARLAAVDKESKRKDWTASYRAWDEWEDPEEVEELERAAHAKSESAAKRAQYGGCSHDHSAERAVYELSTKDKIRDCRAFKLAGNFFYREGQFFRAAEKYRRILIYFEYAFPDNEEDEQALEALRMSALLNLSNCKLRTKQYDDVISFASQALRKEPENVKALYRRAQAHRHRDEFEEAAADISAAVRLAPGDTVLRREVALLRNKLQAYKRNSKKVFRIMLAGDRKGATGRTADDSDDAGAGGGGGGGGTGGEHAPGDGAGARDGGEGGVVRGAAALDLEDDAADDMDEEMFGVG